MKTITFKKSLVAICVLLMACVIGFFAITFTSKSVSAETNSFKMVSGAAVRIIPDNISGNGNSMKFKAQLSKEQLAKYSDTEKYSSATFGMIIMPKAYYDAVQTKFGGAKDINDVSLYAFNEEELTSKSDAMFIAYQMTDNEFNALPNNTNLDGTYKKVRPLSLACKPVAIATNGEHFFSEIDENATIDHYEIWGSLGNIKDKNLVAKYVAQAYVQLVDATTEAVSYEFAEISATDRFRSPLDVSIRAVDSGDYKDDPDVITYLNNFVTTYNNYYKGVNGGTDNPVFEYTVEHWYEGAKIGTTTATAEIAAEVKAPADLTYVATNSEQSNVNYIYANDRSTGKMYAASGELTVRVDYKEKSFHSFGDTNNHKYAESYLNSVDLGTKYDGLASATVNGTAVTLDQSGTNFTLDLNSNATLFSKSKETWNNTYPVEIICAKDVIQGNITYVTQEINTKEELTNWGSVADSQSADTLVFDGYFVLGNDINYNDDYQAWGRLLDFQSANLGDSWYRTDLYGFKGVFDGKGYNIEGLRIKQVEGEFHIGFITILHNEGIFKSTSFTNLVIPGWGSALVDSVGGTVQDIYAHIELLGNGDWDNDANDNKVIDPEEVNQYWRGGQSSPFASSYIDPAAKIKRIFVENRHSGAHTYAFGQTCANVENWSDCYYIGSATREFLARTDDINYVDKGINVAAKYDNWSDFRMLSGHLDFSGWVIAVPEMWAWTSDANYNAPIPAKLNLVNTYDNAVAISVNETEDVVATFPVEVPATAKLYNISWGPMATTSNGTTTVQFTNKTDMYGRLGDNSIVAIDDGNGNMTYTRAVLGNLVIDSADDFDRIGDVSKSVSNKAWQWDGTIYLAKNISYNKKYSAFINWDKVTELNNAQTFGGTNATDSRYNGFYGTFDGRGLNVDGVEVGGYVYGGIFGLISGGDYINNDGTKVWKQGVVKNVSFTNASITSQTGFLASDMAGIVENVFIHATSQAVGSENDPTGFISSKNSYGAARLRNIVVIVDSIADAGDNYAYSTGLGTFWDHIATDQIIHGVAVIGNMNSGGVYTTVGYRAFSGNPTDGWSGCQCGVEGQTCTFSWNDGQKYETKVDAQWHRDAIADSAFIKFDANTNPTTCNLEAMGWDTTTKAFA